MSRALEPKPASGLSDKRWWPWLKRLLSLVFFGLVAWLLVSQARAVEWSQVFLSLRAYPPSALLVAVALAIASLGLYSSFDLLGRRYTGHTLSVPRVMTVTFISYVFNLNLGSLIGGVAFRYRLYSRLGLATGVITRILSLSMLTNWIGYLLLAGLVFSLQPPTLPLGWKIDAAQLRLLGLLLVGLALAYLGLCAFSRQRSLVLRGHTIELPSARLAGLQLLLGASNWLLMSGLIYGLLLQRIAFPLVVSALLLAAVAGVITHVPAGLGVLEAVFVALLSPLLPIHALLAALLAYRVIYYLAPLVLATGVYLLLEGRARQAGKPAPQPA